MVVQEPLQRRSTRSLVKQPSVRGIVLTPEEHAALSEVFRKNVGDDGVLALHEAKKALEALGLSASDPEVIGAFERLKIHHEHAAATGITEELFFAFYTELRPRVKKRNKIHRFFSAVDSIGGQLVTNPGLGPKTALGGVITLVLYVLLIALFIVFFRQFISFKTTQIRGREWYINPNKKGEVDLPPVEFEVDSEITFYEKTSPSLQKIEVVDNFGYSPTITNTLARVPPAKGAYRKEHIVLNSFDPIVQPIAPEQDPVKESLHEIVGEAAAHTFKESLKVIYLNDEIYLDEDDFFNHTAHLYVRFNPEQLAHLKMCQLQVAMWNYGEYEVLAANGTFHEMEHIDKTIVPSFTTSDFTYALKNFKHHKWHAHNHFNLLHLKTHFSEHEYRLYHDGSNVHYEHFLDWMFVFSYVNNFNHTVLDYTCDHDHKCDLQYGLASVINDTATDIVMTSSVQWHVNSSHDNLPVHLPYCILLFGEKGVEKVKVLEYSEDGTTLKVERSKKRPVDFTGVHTGSPQSAPKSWTCQKDWYRAHDGCDCNCGAYDPDCDDSGSTVWGCKVDEQCNHLGFCAFNVPPSPELMWVSRPYRHVFLPGDSVTVGYMGDEHDLQNVTNHHCWQCMWDEFYDGDITILDDGQILCDVTASGHMDARINWEITHGDVETHDGIHAMRIEVQLSNRLRFPDHNLPYPVVLNDGFGTREVVEVLEVHPCVEGKQGIKDLQELVIKYPTQRQIGYGQLYSAISHLHYDIWVKPNTNFEFPVLGPYKVHVHGHTLMVKSASKADAKHTKQRLILSELPDFEQGQVGIIAKEVPAGATSVFVLPTSNQYFFSDLDMPLEALVIKPDEGDLGTHFTGVERVIDHHGWHCEPAHYNHDDGCDCNCGMWDPDCGFPYPDEFTGELHGCEPEVDGEKIECVNGTCTSHITGRQIYCQFDGTCGATNPGHDGEPLAVELIEELVMTHPTRRPYHKGDTVETPAHPGSVNMEMDFVYTDFGVKMMRPGQPEPYSPADRWHTNPEEGFESPHVLDVETAMFVIPDRPNFDELDLCPHYEDNREHAVKHHDDHFHVDPTLHTEVRNCQMETLSTDTCKPSEELPRQKFNIFCHEAMPPTHKFKFDTIFPATFKWDQRTIGNAVPSPAEYQFDYSIIYHFSHDRVVDQAEAQFAENLQRHGDIDQYGEDELFTGGLYYRDVGAGRHSDDLHRILPANSPLLKVHFFIKAHPDAANIMKSYIDADQDANEDHPTYKGHSGGLKGWPSSLEDLKDLIFSPHDPSEGFHSIEIAWDLAEVGGDSQNQSVFLEPGYEYVLQLHVEVTPLYKADWILRTLIHSWSERITFLSITKNQLDYFHRAESHFRYLLEIEPKGDIIIEELEYPFFAFLKDLGAMAGLLGIGILVMKAWLFISRRLFQADVETGLSTIVKASANSNQGGQRMTLTGNKGGRGLDESQSFSFMDTHGGTTSHTHPKLEVSVPMQPTLQSTSNPPGFIESAPKRVGNSASMDNVDLQSLNGSSQSTHPHPDMDSD